MAQMAQTKNKQEAADYLKVSVRTLLRLVDQGKLAHLSKRRPADETIFDMEELDRYQRQLNDEASSIVSGVVVPVTHGAPSGNQALSRRDGSVTLTPVILGTGDALDTPAIQDRMLRAFEAMASPVRLSDKLTLSLTEAALLAGLSRGHLRFAIAEKKLKARIIGRGWRVKRSDLEAYITKL
jgi:excisionase family DNA binding protein